MSSGVLKVIADRIRLLADERSRDSRTIDHFGVPIWNETDNRERRMSADEARALKRTRYVNPSTAIREIDLSKIPVEMANALLRPLEVEEPFYEPGSLEKLAEYLKDEEFGNRVGDLIFSAIDAGAFRSRCELAEIVAGAKDTTVNRHEKGRANGLFLCVANVLLKGEAAYGPGKCVYPAERPDEEPKIVAHERMLRIDTIDFRLACTLVADALDAEVQLLDETPQLTRLELPEGQKRTTTTPDPVAVAVTMKVRNPKLTVRRAAEAVGMSYSVLQKDKTWQAAVYRLKQQGKGNVRFGSKSSDGRIETAADDDERDTEE